MDEESITTIQRGVPETPTVSQDTITTKRQRTSTEQGDSSSQAQGGDDLKFSCLYQIKHALLPPNAPDKLKATQVVMITFKNLTCKSVVVEYANADAVRAFINTPTVSADPDLWRDPYPELEEFCVISNTLAQKLLFREISEEEYNERKHSMDFWLVGDLRSPSRFRPPPHLLRQMDEESITTIESGVPETPTVSQDTQGDSSSQAQGGDDLKFSCLYQIKHALLPPNAPDKLKATQVVMITFKNLTCKSVVVEYANADAVRAFINTPTVSADPDLWRDPYPELEEFCVISNTLAQKLLFREISEEEYNERKHSMDFWLVGGMKL